MMNITKVTKTEIKKLEGDYFNKLNKLGKSELMLKAASTQAQLDAANDVIDRIDQALKPKWFTIAINIVSIIRLILDLLSKYKGLFRA